MTAVDYDVPNHLLDEDGAMLGLAECLELRDSDDPAVFTFELEVDPDEEGDAGPRLAEAWLFELAWSTRTMSCDDSDCIPLDSSEVATSEDSVSVELDPQTLLQGSTCEDDRDVFVRIGLLEDLDDDEELTFADARVRLDVTPPPGREIREVEATDNAIDLVFDGVDDVDDVDNWHVGWAPIDEEPTSADELERLGTVGASASKASFDDVELPLGEQIQVFVWSTDEAGNTSDLSEPFLTEPADSVDYWEAYGDDHAGCSSVSGSATWLPLVMVLAFVLRRRRRTLATILIACVPATAAAETAIVDVRAGTYAPGVSRTEGFSTYFGDELRGMVSLDSAWFFLRRPALNFGLDGGVGYSRLRGESFTEQGTALADGSTLMVLPIRLGMRLTLGERVPWLAASARAGLTSHYFRFSNPGGVAVASDGTVGRGLQWGWHTSALIGIDLTGFDKTSSSKLALSWGIERTILFAEIAYSRADDFGQSSLDLGALQANVGIGFGF